MTINFDGNSYYVLDEHNERIAQLVLIDERPEKLIIEHTEVSDVLRGQGAGAQLIHHAAMQARENGWKLDVWCPYAKHYFLKHPEFQDVLTEGPEVGE